jgi:diguanylate cyclase (GGDEF)-like protein
MYAVIFVVTMSLVAVFHQTAPTWLSYPGPFFLSFIVVLRARYWLKARQHADHISEDRQRSEIRNVASLGTGLAFGFSIVGYLLMDYSSATQQALALTLIWSVAMVSAFCLHAVPVAALGVVIASTLPLSAGFLESDNPIVIRLVPVFLLITVLIVFVLLELFRAFAKLVHSSDTAARSEVIARHAADHDPLTGLPNRSLLKARLEAMLASKREHGGAFAVHCIDLDRFKEVNETFGHVAGDELLQRVAQQFSGLCGPADILARIGGDEFVLVQDAKDAAAAETLAMQIVELMAAPTTLDSGRVFVGCSIGICLVEDATLDPLECVRRADLALYKAKNEGRRRHVFFDLSVDEAHQTKQRLRDELRDALLHEELTVVYQKQVRNHQVFGVEALVRWKTRERGEIEPSRFVPIAEESGLIDALGNFVIRRAFLDARKLKGLRISVNVSAAQIRMHDFVGKLQFIAAETDIDPTRVELEITEGLLLGNEPEIRQSLDQLRALGFRIVLDDFGTGYSSLGYLHHYPIDKIKIDRLFVLNMGPDAKYDAIVTAIVGMARALGVEIIAEGVETEAQHVRLSTAGCADFQGYLFGRPMALSDLLADLALS